MPRRASSLSSEKNRRPGLDHFHRRRSPPPTWAMALRVLRSRCDRVQLAHRDVSGGGSRSTSSGNYTLPGARQRIMAVAVVERWCPLAAITQRKLSGTFISEPGDLRSVASREIGSQRPDGDDRGAVRPHVGSSPSRSRDEGARVQAGDGASSISVAVEPLSAPTPESRPRRMEGQGRQRHEERIRHRPSSSPNAAASAESAAVEGVPPGPSGAATNSWWRPANGKMCLGQAGRTGVTPRRPAPSTAAAGLRLQPHREAVTRSRSNHGSPRARHAIRSNKPRTLNNEPRLPNVTAGHGVFLFGQWSERSSF